VWQYRITDNDDFFSFVVFLVRFVVLGVFVDATHGLAVRFLATITDDDSVDAGIC
jgi:hypothetical protein